MCSLTIECVLLHIHRMLFNTQQEREPEHGPRERGNRDREGRDEERGGGGRPSEKGPGHSNRAVSQDGRRNAETALKLVSHSVPPEQELHSLARVMLV